MKWQPNNLRNNIPREDVDLDREVLQGKGHPVQPQGRNHSRMFLYGCWFPHSL